MKDDKPIGIPRGRSGNKKRIGRPRVRRFCDLCKDECRPEAFCFGCRANICPKCDKHPSLRNCHRGVPTVPHKRDDHKVEHFHQVYGKGGPGEDDIPF